MPDRMFDVIVIGAGSAGFSAAEAARDLGVSVAIVEAEKLGGECPNWACVPTKAMLKCARVYRSVKQANDFGITVRRVDFNFASVMAYKDRVVAAITGGGEVGARYERIADDLGLTVVNGQAAFEDAHTLVVTHNGTKTTLTAKAFVIATGSVEFVPSIEGLDKAGYLTFHDAVSLKKAPVSVAIIGGGPVGCEFATFFATFGVATTIIQASSALLQREDHEISEMAGKAMRELGVNVLMNAKTLSISSRDTMKEIKLEVNGEEQTILTESILLATGKRARVENLQLGLAGVALDDRGNIVTSSTQATNVSHIFAAGDVDGGYQFTHTGHYEGLIAGANAAQKALGKKRGFAKSDQRVVPRVTFIDPEVASVGQTEEEAKAKIGQVYVGKFPLSGLGRSVTEGVQFGWLKVIADPKTGEILGGHMIGERAGEVIHELALAMKLHATLNDLGELIHAFPTYSEAIAGAIATVELL